jgi:glycosyltransferase involved in cell wall biosynthesis
VKPTLHLLGIFHTLPTTDFDHCAFTGKARRFPRMMQVQGYRVIEYANEGSDAGADEHVTMLTTAECEGLYGYRDPTSFHGDTAIVGNAGHQAFEQRLIPALRDRVRSGDIICHPFGHAHQGILGLFPDCYHVETGIGYPTVMDGSFHVYESYAWMHWHAGKAQRHGRNYDWVIPNYFDLADWEPRHGTGGDYLAFLGRICHVKGLDTIRAIADHSPVPVHIAGQGDPSQWQHPNIAYRGPLKGSERSDFLRGALALLAPSLFIEPFCGMAVEAMLCGTPVLSVNYGAMTETVIEGLTGYRCHTLQDWIDGIEKAAIMDRQTVAYIARTKYGLDACGRQYDRMFRAISELGGKGWYTLRNDTVGTSVAA